jgi:hypothetical protein
VGSNEPEVVKTEDLRRILLEWQDQWYAERVKLKPLSGWARENSRSENVPRIHPLDWLSFETGYSRKRFEVIISGKFEWTTLPVADALLTAIGHPEYLHTRLQIVPNPHWSNERYVSYMRRRGCM